MRIIVLAGDGIHHRCFVKRLLDKGYETSALGEARGQRFNEDSFKNGDKSLQENQGKR